MTSDDESMSGSLTDAAVSARYRACSDETTPVEVDRRIIRAAGNALESGAAPGWMLSWLRPATFVATLGLSIALLLELGEIEEQVTIPGHDHTAVRQEVDTAAASDKRGAALIPGQSTAPAVLPGTEAVPQAPLPATVDSFREAVDAAAQEVRELGAAADANLQQRPETQAVPATASGEIPAEIEAPACTDEQKANAEDWRLCIDKLVRTGMTEQAGIEKRALQERFPEFQPR